jgi:hypothetical protein
MKKETHSQDLFNWSDFPRLAKLLTGGFVAALIPSRFDEAAASSLLRFHPATQPERTMELASLMADVLAHRRSGDWHALAKEHASMTVEDYWGRFRGMGPRGWHPAIEFSGEIHVRNALMAGRGAIFWCMRFSSDIVLKQGFHQLGLPLVHLSGVQHGAGGSRTKLATAIISPLFKRAENPYLSERVVIPLGGSLAYLRRLREQLRGNACVSIFGDPTGRQAVEVPFLTGHRKFATGAPSIAWTENCALFSAYVIRTGKFKYRVVVDEPIQVDRSLPRKEFLKKAVEEFARRMERLVECYPADWQDWVEWKQSQDLSTMIQESSSGTSEDASNEEPTDRIS